MKIFRAEEYTRDLASSTSCQTCEKVPLPHIGADEDYIFISYAHRDYKKVYADIAAMYEAGVRFWYDRGLSAGKNWDDEVMEKLTSPNCVGVIFYMSEHLFLSQSAFREIEMAYRLSRTEANADRPPFKHFSVNLTDKRPGRILFDSNGCDAGRHPSMEEIGVLAQMFPDLATYLCYDHPGHKNDLIHQIKSQFGVVNHTAREYVSLQIDRLPSSVFITTAYENMSTPGRLRLVEDIQNCLRAAGITSYAMQDNSGSILHDELSESLKEYVALQNEAKLEAARHVLFISTLLGWQICTRFTCEFDPAVSFLKEVYYLIDDKSISAETFMNLYKLDENSDVMQRVFFLSDYQQRLPEAIRRCTAAE